MPRRLSTLTTLGLAAPLALLLPSCGPPAPSVTPPATADGSAGGGPWPAAGNTPVDPVDAMEHAVAEAIVRARESAVALEYSSATSPGGARRVASGVVVGDNGEVLSVRIDPPSAASPIVARVASGRRLLAHWVATDPETGLTLLRIEPGTTRPAAPSTRGARLGMPLLVIGNPFGLAHSVSRGFVSGLGRRLDLSPRQLGGLIQVDAALHPGDSGALLADLHGAWIGMIRSGLATPDEDDRRARGDDHHDLGFAIPAADALWVAGQLRDRGRVDRAYLGVTMDHAAASAAPTAPAGGTDAAAGAVLGRVLADSPADRAGLKTGDRVVAIDGQTVRTPYDLTDRLDRTPADSDVTLDLVRGDAHTAQVKRLTLRASRRPPIEPSRPAKPHDREKVRADDPRTRRDLGETIDRLERRVRELEKEKGKRDEAVQVRGKTDEAAQVPPQ